MISTIIVLAFNSVLITILLSQILFILLFFLLPAGHELHIWGSSELLQTLIAAELVDEFRVWVFPLVLGQGKRLFENGVPPRGLTLVESRNAPNGVLLTIYRPAGPLPGGSLAPENPSEAELARRKKLAAETN
jgi:hypothetical protein